MTNNENQWDDIDVRIVVDSADRHLARPFFEACELEGWTNRIVLNVAGTGTVSKSAVTLVVWTATSVGREWIHEVVRGALQENTLVQVIVQNDPLAEGPQDVVIVPDPFGKFLAVETSHAKLRTDDAVVDRFKYDLLFNTVCDALARLGDLQRLKAKRNAVIEFWPESWVLIDEYAADNGRLLHGTQIVSEGFGAIRRNPFDTQIGNKWRVTDPQTGEARAVRAGSGDEQGDARSAAMNAEEIANGEVLVDGAVTYVSIPPKPNWARKLLAFIRD